MMDKIEKAVKKKEPEVCEKKVDKSKPIEDRSLFTFVHHVDSKECVDLEEAKDWT